MNLFNDDEKEGEEVSKEEMIKEGERRREVVRTVDEQTKNTHSKSHETHAKLENTEHHREEHPRDEPASMEGGSSTYLGGEFRNGGGNPWPAEPTHKDHRPVEHHASENPSDGTGKNASEGSGENPDEDFVENL